MINKGASMSGGARTSRTLAAGVALAGMLVLVLVTVVVPLAFGSGTQMRFDERPFEVTTYSTRAHFVGTLYTESTEVKWCSEYSTSKSGPWTPSGCEVSKSVSAGQLRLYLGTGEQNAVPNAIQHHLLPERTYYVRFFAENSAQEKAEIVYSPAFTTKPIAKPEVSPPNLDAPPESRGSLIYPTTPTTGQLQAEIDSNGSPTSYDFEYAPAEAGHAPAEGSPSWAAFASGTVTVEEDFVNHEAKLTGLLPETTYCTRVKAVNSQGQTIEHNGGTLGSGPNSGEEGCFTTPTEKPLLQGTEARNVTGSSAHLQAEVNPHRLETRWWFEYATSSAGPWSRVPGAEGVVTQAQAEALPEGNVALVGGALAGLKPSTTYYVRLFAENSAGEGEVCYRTYGGAHNHNVCESASTETFFVASFKTFGPPVVSTLAVHGLHGEAIRVMGGVSPETVPTSAEQVIALEGAPTGGTFTLTFAGETTQPIAFDAPAEGPGGVGSALKALAALPEDVSVSGAPGGPYTVYFFGVNGEKAQPAITAVSALTPAGQVKVTVVLKGGEVYDVRYHFDYVSQKQFEAPGAEGGFAKAAHTPDESAGFGNTVQYVGADLPGLSPGETYRFRLVASSTAPGNPVVTGEEQSLTVPVLLAGAGAPAGGCPNEAVRAGLSARLPDCRAFEQLTPVDKEGAKEIFNYGGASGQEGVLPAEDGNRVELGEQVVAWGSQPRDGQSPYFFSRGAAGWLTTAGAAQPEAGISSYTPKLYSPDLGEVALEASWSTGPGGEASEVEFKQGPVGGPYTLMASVPTAEAGTAGGGTAQVGQGFGWVASSSDFSKLVLQVGDHHLCEAATGTTGGDYLYEYAGGECRQVNVAGSGAGKTLGSCGARIAAGTTNVSPLEFLGTEATAKAHAVSHDGSRVFFEAQPGKSCSEPWHTYARIDGGGEDAHTVDLGAYRFVAADSSGSRVLLERPEGENPGLYLYTSESEHAVFLPGSGVAVPGPNSEGVVLMPSEDLSAVYIQRGNMGGDQDIYRYDIAGRKLAFVTHIELNSHEPHFEVSRDGRYFYFIAATVAGLPAGGQELETPGANSKGQTAQVFRYDNREAEVQCMSCASAYDPEPRLSALFTFKNSSNQVASDNGDYVFFDTPAALVPGDTDGQIAPEGARASGGVHTSDDYSLSSDVYEWRRGGVDGCAAIQGCVSLITSGHGGFLNILLGADRTGENVFFATNESLLPSDNDMAGDIYDARVNGGFAQPPVPVACAGDSCATPPAPPSDETPASFTFHGVESTLVAAPAVHVKAKAKPKRRCKRTREHRCKAAARHHKAKRATRSARAAGAKGGRGR
jgi:hypothetical protein